MTINLSNAAALVRDDMTTIKAQFQRSNGKDYTFLCPGYIAYSLKPGDFVAVESFYDGENRLSIAEVVEIHSTPQVDPEFEHKYRWAFQKIAVDNLQRLKKEDEKIEEYLREKQKENARSQVLDALGGSQEEIRRIIQGTL